MHNHASPLQNCPAIGLEANMQTLHSCFGVRTLSSIFSLSVPQLSVIPQQLAANDKIQRCQMHSKRSALQEVL